ncbi:unnamed protein product [Arctia plantaginis]|uniref:Uncharacterized protein n=1 Tax=Arctia plantaginis TaxID=874455 RepID=A0A8S0Z505_ARCPL|nr:unnamed protein product [Arctia plantaginis]CAB3228214.1 unnamed protein product [Arctia plantaginis]
MRQEYAYDKNPVEFDVASFVQPDEDTITDEETTRRRNQRRRRISKNNDYNSVFGLNMDEGNSGDVNQDYLSLGDPPAKLNPTLLDLGPTVLKDSLNIKKFKMNAMDESNAKYTRDNIKNQIVMPEPNPAHNPQKKCVFKSIKFPFFSHNKTESLKPKKNKKRRLFGFNSVKKSESEVLSGKDKMEINPINQFKIKRSYQVIVCPACKKKYISNLRYKKTPDKIIHNSRQFYQKQSDEQVTEDINRNTKYYYDDSEKVIKTDRSKRQDLDKYDKDRQLKLLDEIQRKVDSVNVTIPKFNRVSTQ